MFQWLANLCLSFRRDERQIFSYRDGVQHRKIDPLVAWRALHAPPVSWKADMRIAANPKKKNGESFYPDDEICAAEDRLLNLTRRVFGVQEWTEKQSGLTVQETMELLGSYLRYIGDVKKKHSPSPMPSPVSESTAPPRSLDAADSATNSESESFSMPVESIAEEPGPQEKLSAPV